MMGIERNERRILAAVAMAGILGAASAGWAVAEIETPSEPDVEQAMPPVGTEPAPRVAPQSMEATPPQVERKSLPDPAMDAAMATAGEVARSAFTREVLEREPQGEVQALENDATEIAYFTELRGLDGHRVTHVWEFNGESMAEVAFEVRGERWRVHSTKRLDPSWTGTWTVSVLDADGRELSRETFDYVEVGGAPGDQAYAPAAAAPAMP